MVIVESPWFTRFIDDAMDDEDYRELQNALIADPAFGDPIPGGRGRRSIMDKKQFEELLGSVRWMGKHMRGEKVPARVLEFPEPDVRAIRRAARVSQSQFAALIGVNVRTLQNWEQKRVRPTGPARALLRIVEVNPGALAALHGPQGRSSNGGRKRAA